MKASRVYLVIMWLIKNVDRIIYSETMSGRGRVGFLKPQEDGESYEEDRPDIQPLRFCSYTVST